MRCSPSRGSAPARRATSATCSSRRSARTRPSRQMPLVTLDRVSIAYGHLPLLADASLQVEPRERVCVIGRNGTGKSTLLRIISGELAPEGGSVWHQPGLRIGSLAQDVPLNDPRSVSAVVSEGITDLRDTDEWRKYQLVAITLSRLGL